MSTSTPQADLAAVQTDLTTLQSQLEAVNISLDNILKTSYIKGAYNSAHTGVARLNAAKTTVTEIADQVAAAIAALNTPAPTPAPTPTPTPTPTPAGPTPPSALGADWALSYSDEFNGTSLDTGAWDTHDGWNNQNGVTDHASNVSVHDGSVHLALPASNSGAAIQNKVAQVAVGDYVEARINFAGNGNEPADWPAFWVSGPNWPQAGESDIAEGLGTLTVNYHSPSGAHNMGTIPGDWVNGFHTYGLHRKQGACDVYWDGQLVKSYTTDDNGQPESIILTVGYGGGTFVPMELACDYVRLFKPTA